MNKMEQVIHINSATQNQLRLIRKLTKSKYLVFIRQSRLSSTGADMIIKFLMGTTDHKPEFWDYYIIPKNIFKKGIDK